MAEQGSGELRAKRQVFYPQLTAGVSLGQSREELRRPVVLQSAA